MTSFIFRETLMTHLLLWGNAYAQIIRNGKGEVVALYPLMPDRMKVDRDDSGQLYYEYQVSKADPAVNKSGMVRLHPHDVLHIPGLLYYEYQVSKADPAVNKSGMVRLHPHDVLHIPGLGFDGLVGYSPIAMAKNAIGMAIACEEYGAKFFAHGAAPSGVLEHPMAKNAIGMAIACEEYGAKFFAHGAAPSGVLEHPGTLKDPSRVRESWQATFGGSSNSGKVAVLEEGMKYTPISVPPEQAQFLETRKFQINEIARIFRVPPHMVGDLEKSSFSNPPHMVGDLEKSSFSNIEQQSLDFVKYTLDPWVSLWEQAMTKVLFSEDEKQNFSIKFNVDGLLRGDYQSRMNGYAIARQNGWMSANDIRRLEELDPLPAEDGGDLYLVNGNMLPLEKAGGFYSGKETSE